MLAFDSPEHYRMMSVLRGVEPDADCSLIEREKRILPREIYVLLTDGGHLYEANSKDKNVKRYCKRKNQATGQGLISAAKSWFPSIVHLKGPEPTPSPTKPSVHLPNEIIYQILSYFTSADAARSEDGSYRTYCSLCHLKHLYTCCLISKAWYGAALRILYSNLKLDLDGTCEYHWRGIPWCDGKSWWARRHSYLNDRYLKPLLRTLTARSDLAQCFRTVEIDIHDHMKPDYKALPLYTKLIALCPNLSSIIGDPCIFFCPNHEFPSCQDSYGRRFANRLSGGYVKKRARLQTLKQQQKLQEVLNQSVAWESWEIDGCQDISPPFISTNWKNLKHLSFKNFYSYHHDPTAISPLDYLDSLESLSLVNTSLGVLSLVPNNKLIALTIESPDSYVLTPSSFPDLKDLWAYLSRGMGTSSRLQRLSISIPPRHAPLTKKWLLQTLSLAPNLRELSLSTQYEIKRNYIILKDDSDLDEFPVRQPFPTCANLQKLSYSFPGWTHNELLVELLSNEGAFPMLVDLVCFRSSAVVELNESADWYPPRTSEARMTSKEKGLKVDEDLELELIGKRGMNRIAGSIGWRKVRFGRDVKVDYM